MPLSASCGARGPLTPSFWAHAIVRTHARGRARRRAMDPRYSRAELKRTFNEYEAAFVEGISVAQLKEYLAAR